MELQLSLNFIFTPDNLTVCTSDILTIEDQISINNYFVYDLFDCDEEIYI